MPPSEPEAGIAGLAVPKILTEMAAIKELSRARLPTKHGDFTVVAFVDARGDRLEDVAMIRGVLADPPERIPVRLHSECLTGDVLASLRCDCGEQLHVAMQRLAASTCGVLLYMRQEGRGIGIASKIEAYKLQDEGMDTVQANLHLGFDDDMRSYNVAAGMLLALGVRRIDLHTNNPNKVDGLRSAGIDVVSRVPLIVQPRAENRFYLQTKQLRSGHLFEHDDDTED
jgi:GTP cyclohydrolase II